MPETSILKCILEVPNRNLPSSRICFSRATVRRSSAPTTRPAWQNQWMCRSQIKSFNLNSIDLICNHCNLQKSDGRLCCVAGDLHWSSSWLILERGRLKSWVNRRLDCKACYWSGDKPLWVINRLHYLDGQRYAPQIQACLEHDQASVSSGGKKTRPPWTQNH